MRLCGPDGQSVELRVVGYEFPDLAEAEYDSNWLQIEGNVIHPHGQWSFRDGCLLTYEVSRLADWLDAVARNDPSSNEIGFIELNLSFRAIRSDASAFLRVYFELESRPTWAESRAAGANDLWVQFPVDELALRQAARSLRQQLAAYPQRTKR